MFYAIVHWVASLVFRLCLRLEVRGAENIPGGGPFILAANHLSNLDPFIIGVSTRRRLAFFAKSELFRFRAAGYLLDRLGAFPVRRGRMDRPAIRTALERLEQGSGLLLFPEGTRRRPGGLDGERKAGLGMLAAHSGAPLIPTRIVGSDRVLPPGRALPRPVKVVVHFGPPIPAPRESAGLEAGQGKKKVYLRLVETVLQRIYDLH